MAEVTTTDRGNGRGKLIVAWIGALVGWAGIAACITAATIGMHDVMVSTAEAGSAGFCASGGPYEIASECQSGQIALLTGGIIGALIFTAIQAAFLAWVDGPRPGVFAVVAALMAAFGWNFLALAFDTPGSEGVNIAWLACGILFFVMALGFLAPMVFGIVEWFRRGGEPEEVFAPASTIVRAAVRDPSQASGSGTSFGSGTGSEPASVVTTSGLAATSGVVATSSRSSTDGMSRSQTLWFVAGILLGIAVGIPIGITVARSVLS